MKKFDGFADMKPPSDFVSPDWIEDLYLTEPSDSGSSLWLVALGTLSGIVGVCIGFWLATS